MTEPTAAPEHDDPFNLRRFVTAQDRVYADVLAELQDGQKLTHWMWFIFPQDDLKLRSSMTLFAQIAGPQSVYARVLQRYFHGEPDDRTLHILERFQHG